MSSIGLAQVVALGCPNAAAFRKNYGMIVAVRGAVDVITMEKFSLVILIKSFLTYFT
jgi:hypothetical protein